MAPFRWFSLCRRHLASSVRHSFALFLLVSGSVLVGCGGGEEPAADAGAGGAAAAEGAAAGGGGGMAMAPPPDGSESSDAGGAMAGGMQSGPPGGMPMGAMGGPPDEMTAGGAAAGPAGEMAAGAAGGAGGFQLPGGAPVQARNSDVSKWTDDEMKDAVRQSDRRVIQAIDARVKSKPGDPAVAALLLELLAVSTEPPPTPVMPAGSAAAGGYPGMQGMAPGGMPGMLGGSSAAGFSGVPSSGGGAPPGLSEMSAGASAGGQNSSAPPGVVPSSGGGSSAPPGLAPPQSSIRRRPPQDSIGAMLAEYATAYQANPAVGAMRGGFKVPGPAAGPPGGDGGLSGAPGAPGDGIVPGGIGMPPGMGGDGIVPGGIGMPPGMGGGEMSGGDLFSGAGAGPAAAAPAATLSRELVSAVADGLIQNGSEEAWQSLFAIVSGSAKSPVSLEENAEIVTVSLIKNLDVDPQQVSQVIVAIIDGTAPLPVESRVSSLNTMAELAGRSLDKLTGLSPAAAGGMGGGDFGSGGGLGGMAGGMAGMMGSMMGGGGMPGMPGMSEGMAGGMGSMAGMRGGSMPGMPQMPGVAGAGPVGGAPGMGPPGMPSMPGVSGAGPVSGAPGMSSMGPPGMPGMSGAMSGAPGMAGGELSAGGGPMSGMGMPGMGQAGMGMPGMGQAGMGQPGIPTGPAQAVGLQAVTEAIVTKARLLLWSKPCIDAVAGALQQAGDLTSADGLLKLAAGIPAEPVRDAEFAFFQKIHSTGSDSLNSNGFFLTAAHDPGLLAVLKSLPRSKGSRDDEGQSAMDSWALSSQQLVLTYVDQLRAMSQAPGSKLSPNQKSFPVRPHRNAEFDFTGLIRITPNPANPAEASIAETRIYYARAAFSPKKARDSEDVMKHYKSAVAGVQRSDQARALTWLDGGKSGGTGMRRSMDVIIREGTVGTPGGGADGGRMGGMAGPTGGEFAGGGAMGGGAGGNYVIEVVIVEIADPQPEVAAGAAAGK